VQTEKWIVQLFGHAEKVPSQLGLPDANVGSCFDFFPGAGFSKDYVNNSCEVLLF